MRKTAARLVEREMEVARIVDSIESACAGDGRGIAIRGGAGIGKTKLLETAVALARDRGMTALRASAGPLEREFPFGVVRQLFERRLRAAAEAERARLLEGAAGLAAAALGFRPTRPLRPDPSFAPLHGLYWLVANLSAERPLLLAVDDLQWADPGSLRFLAYLDRRLGDLPVVLVTTGRTGEPEAEPALIAELSAGPRTTSMTPAPLSEAGARRLLGRELGEAPSPDLIDRFHAATAGNPFLLHELARAVESGDTSLARDLAAPRSVAQAIVARLTRLGPPVVALAEATVILGDGCSLAEAGALSGLDADDAAAAADSLVREEILAREEALSFVHPLVRSAIEAEMTPSERGARHSHAARLLLRRGAERERIVAQLLAGSPGGEPDAVAMLEAAGREALARGAPGTAVRFLQRALDESPAEGGLGDLLTDLGVGLVLTDRPAEAEPRLSRARQLATDPETLADRTLKLWFALLAEEKIDEGVALIESTISRLEETGGDGEREAMLMLEGEFVTAALFDPDRLQRTWQRLEHFESLPGHTPAERRLLSMVTAKSQYVAGHSAAELAEIARRSYGEGRLIDENPLDPTKWAWGAAVLITTDQTDAEAVVERALSSARATGSLETLLMVHDLRSYLALKLGRLEDAETTALEGLTRLAETDAMPMRELQRVNLVRLALPAMVARDRAEAADRLLAEQGLDGELEGGVVQVKLHRERGLVRLAQGRNEEALEEARMLAAYNRRHKIEDVVEAPWQPVAARAQANLGNYEEAAAAADQHLGLTRRWGLPRDVGAALRVRAAAERDNERRTELLRESLMSLKAAPAPLETAETEAELGRAILRSGRRTEAREVLGRALDGATRCGAVALAGTVRDDLKVAGARPRRAHLSGLDALTAAERRTAQMAASGLTNREIAQALFLSVRTVENTLGRVYRKLGIETRRDLSPILGRLDSP